jgi:hypothetical protein
MSASCSFWLCIEILKMPKIKPKILWDEKCEENGAQVDINLKYIVEKL